MTTWDLFCAVHLAEDLTVLGPKCQTADCIAVVAARVHWVTGPIEVCAACEAHWRRVANVGFDMALHVESLSYTPGGLDDTEQRMRLLELS